MQDLLDFDVAIEPLGDGYRARVIASPAGDAYTDFALPFTDDDLTILILRVIGSIGRASRKVRRIQTEERGLLEDFGGELFRAVFSGSVRECLGRSRLVADGRDAGLRVRLRLPGTLTNIPWEYLYDAGYGFLGLSPEIALVRYLEMPVPVRPFPISPPLRILAMVSAPTDVPGLEGEEEWDKLTGDLDELIRGGLVEVDRLEAGTLAALQRPLRLREYHVLHFIGHGGYDEDAQDGALALEGADRKTRLVTGRDLGLMIRGHRSLRLVVLNACEGARSACDDPFGGVAQALVRQGIPAVIAMQFEISDPAALMFSRSFYQAIADGLPVDVATLEARRAMFAEGNEIEWATPVLYLRSPDGRIFSRAQKPTDRQAREETDRQALEIIALQSQLRAKFAREEFQTVVALADRLIELDPAAADPDGLTTQARQRIQQPAAEASVQTAQDIPPTPVASPRPHVKPPTDTGTPQAPRLIHTLPGHPSAVYCVAFSPDGRLLAGAATDRTVRLWDLASGGLLKTLTGHTGSWREHSVRCVAFSPDGRRLASAAEDQTVRLWDPTTGVLLKTLTGHKRVVLTVTFSPDGRLLASGSRDGTMRLWDTATGECQRTMKRTSVTNYVRSVAFSPDGQLLASVVGCGAVLLWDPATGEHLRTLTGHASTIYCVAFSPNGQLLASGGSDKVVVWDLGQPAVDRVADQA